MGLWDTEYIPGQWNAICDICGLQYKSSKLMENWKGQRVCEKDFEGKHPQMFVRPRPEKITTDWARLPAATEVWTGADYIGPITTTITFTSLRSATVDATAGNCVLTLPSAATEFSYGDQYRVERVDNSSNTVTVNGQSIGAYEAIIFKSNGTTWSVFGRIR